MPVQFPLTVDEGHPGREASGDAQRGGRNMDDNTTAALMVLIVFTFIGFVIWLVKD